MSATADALISVSTSASDEDSTFRLGLPHYLKDKREELQVESPKGCLAMCCDTRTAIVLMDSFYLVSIVCTLIALTFLYGDYNSVQYEGQAANQDEVAPLFQWIIAQLSHGDPVLNLSPLAAQVLRMLALLFGLFGVAVTNEYWVICTLGSISLDLIRAGSNGHWVGVAFASIYFYPHAIFVYRMWKDRQEIVAIEQDGWCHV